MPSPPPPTEGKFGETPSQRSRETTRSSGTIEFSVPAPKELEPPAFSDILLEQSQQMASSVQGINDICKKHHQEMIEGWTKQIKAMLIFTGLLSAILSPLVVDAYSRLDPRPSDSSAAVLAHLSMQLSSFVHIAPFVNSTHSAYLRTDALPVDAPPRWAVWLNALWNSSLFFSLAATSVGVSLYQWLVIYSHKLAPKTLRDFSKRGDDAGWQERFRQDIIQKFCVEGLVTFLLPTFVQIALLLFFAGLLVLLWNLHATVAIIMSVLVSALVLFTVAIPFVTAICSDSLPQAPVHGSIFPWFTSNRPAQLRDTSSLSDVDVGQLIKDFKSYADGLHERRSELHRRAYETDWFSFIELVPDVLFANVMILNSSHLLSTVHDLRERCLHAYPKTLCNIYWFTLLTTSPPLHCSVTSTLAQVYEQQRIPGQESAEGADGESDTGRADSILEDLEATVILQFPQSFPLARLHHLISVYASVVVHADQQPRLTAVALEALWWCAGAYIRSPAVDTSGHSVATVMAYLRYVGKAPTTHQLDSILAVATRKLHQAAILFISTAFEDSTAGENDLQERVLSMLKDVSGFLQSDPDLGGDISLSKAIDALFRLSTASRYVSRFSPFAAVIQELHKAAKMPSLDTWTAA